MEIAVDTRAWNRECCADVGDAKIVLNADLGQTKVALVGDAGVEPDRARIEIVIFREKSFVEAVITKPRTR